MDSSSLKTLFPKFVSEDPSMKDFIFCIFWLCGHQTNTFCWNFDWKPKSNLRPLLVRCASLVNATKFSISPRTALIVCTILYPENAIAHCWASSTVHGLSSRNIPRSRTPYCGPCLEASCKSGPLDLRPISRKSNPSAKHYVEQLFFFTVVFTCPVEKKT